MLPRLLLRPHPGRLAGARVVGLAAGAGRAVGVARLRALMPAAERQERHPGGVRAVRHGRARPAGAAHRARGQDGQEALPAAPVLLRGARRRPGGRVPRAQQARARDQEREWPGGDLPDERRLDRARRPLEVVRARLHRRHARVRRGPGADGRRAAGHQPLDLRRAVRRPARRHRAHPGRAPQGPDRVPERKVGGSTPSGRATRGPRGSARAPRASRSSVRPGAERFRRW